MTNQSMIRTPKAVIFELFDKADSRFHEVSVPMAHVEAFFNDNGGVLRVIKVIWADGVTSWAKHWTFNSKVEDKSLIGKLARIGGGAYGDVPVWAHAA